MMMKPFIASEVNILCDNNQGFSYEGPNLYCNFLPAVVAAGYGAAKVVDALTDRQTGYRVTSKDVINQNDYNWKGPSTDTYRDQGNQAQNRQAEQANYDQANFAKALSMQSRGNQNEAMGLMRNAAMGNGPSAAQAQFQSGLDQSMRAQNSMANSARGGGLARAAAQRQAMQNAGDMQAQGAAQSASLRAQEMQAAMSGYGSMATNARGQDLSLMGQEAQMSQYQTDQKMKQHGLNDAMQQSYEQLGFGAAKQQQEGAIAYNKQKSENWATEGKINADIEKYNQEHKGWLSSDYNAKTAIRKQEADAAITQFLKALEDNKTSSERELGEDMDHLNPRKPEVNVSSDENRKTDIHDAKLLHNFLDALKAYDYRYKDPHAPGASEGRHTSVMAQDLEKTKLGARMVVDTPNGKMVNYGEGFATMLAAQASLNKRLDHLEKTLASRGSK